MPLKRKPGYEECNAAAEQRDRNALYSRRSYHRRKMIRLAVEGQVRSWEERNAAARAEGERLEQLMRQAQMVVSVIEGKTQISDGGSFAVSNSSPFGIVSSAYGLGPSSSQRDEYARLEQ